MSREPAAIAIRSPRSAAELRAALGLRETVFCGEQGVALELERDGRDDAARHLVAIQDGVVVGTCRLLVDGDTAKLGRLAVAPAARARGIGRALLLGAEEEAREAGARRMALHAQSHASAMYSSAGFTTRGDAFEEAGIEHVAMDKRLV